MVNCPLLLEAELVTTDHVTGGERFVVDQSVQLLPHVGQVTVNVPPVPVTAKPSVGGSKATLIAPEVAPVPQLPIAAIL